MAGEIIVSTINGAGFDGGNVVYNPEFTINQRGAASRIATTGYNFDRWYYDGTRLLQGIEGNNLRAGTYVISWEGSSTAAFSLNTAAAASQGSQSYTSVTNGGTITIASVGSNNLWIRFTSDLTNLTKVKVSPGTQASGFVARPYGTELALCQRYYEKSYNVPVAIGTATLDGALLTTRIDSVGGGSAFFKVSKRAAPTVTVYSPTSGSSGMARNYTASADTAASAQSIGENAFYLLAGSAGINNGLGAHYTASAEL